MDWIVARSLAFSGTVKLTGAAQSFYSRRDGAEGKLHMLVSECELRAVLLRSRLLCASPQKRNSNYTQEKSGSIYPGFSQGTGGHCEPLNVVPRGGCSMQHPNIEETPEKRRQGVGWAVFFSVVSIIEDSNYRNYCRLQGWRDLINTLSHFLLSCSRWGSCRNGWQSWVVVVY